MWKKQTPLRPVRSHISIACRLALANRFTSLDLSPCLD
jgi:hypothetical protein